VVGHTVGMDCHNVALPPREDGSAWSDLPEGNGDGTPGRQLRPASAKRRPTSVQFTTFHHAET